MGQLEVLLWLSEQRLRGDHRYFNTHTLYFGLRDGGLWVGHLNCLYKTISKMKTYGYLEVKRDNGKQKAIRVKKKYCITKRTLCPHPPLLIMGHRSENGGACANNG